MTFLFCGFTSAALGFSTTFSYFTGGLTTYFFSTTGVVFFTEFSDISNGLPGSESSPSTFFSSENCWTYFGSESSPSTFMVVIGLIS
jgi:hypothetical protein